MIKTIVNDRVIDRNSGSSLLIEQVHIFSPGLQQYTWYLEGGWTNPFKKWVTHFFMCTWSDRLRPKKPYPCVAVPPAPVRIPNPFHLPRVSRQSRVSDNGRVIIRWLCKIPWHLLYGWGKLWKISTRKLSDKDCATSHRLRWGPLPPIEVARIAQHAVVDWDGFPYLQIRSATFHLIGWI